MDAPLPDDFDPYKLDEAAHQVRDECDDHQQQRDHRSNADAAQRRPKRPVRKPAPELPESPHERTSMLKELFDFLIPPRDDKPENIRRWRITIGIAACVLCFSTLADYGVVRWPGFSGFAYAQDVKSINLELLEQRILDARVRQCNATTQESRQFYLEKVQGLLRKFTEAEGQYRLPTCDEVR